MKRLSVCVLAVVLAVGVSSAFACDKAKTDTGKTASVASAKSGCSKDCSKADSCVTASLARVWATLPQMTYKVGDFETNCPHTAKAKSEETSQPVQYVVDGQTYDSPKTAQNKLAGLIEANLDRLTKVYPTVDGETMRCSETAAKVASEKSVPVKYTVAGVQFDCPQKAQAAADKLTAKLASFRTGDEVASGNAMTASNKAGCAKSGCSKSAEAKTASADKSGCDKPCNKAAEGESSTVTAKADTAGEEEYTPELARAREIVRRVVEFVASERTS